MRIFSSVILNEVKNLLGHRMHSDSSLTFPCMTTGEKQRHEADAPCLYSSMSLRMKILPSSFFFI